jgi:predicted MFS family arabinose efflux permease
LIAASPPAADPVSRAAKWAVYVVFTTNGFVLASFASRIPQLRDGLGVTPAGLGLILLSAAIGSLIAMPLSGMVVTRLGEASTVTVMSLILAVGLATVAVGSRFGAIPVVLGLFLLGFGNGTWDVAMNVQGARVEQGLGRVIMARFHAAFSLGTVIGALIGTGMVALQVPVTVHLLAVAALAAVVVPTAVRRFLPAAVLPATKGEDVPRRSHPLAAWLELRTVLIGLFVLCMAFTEGTGNDWLAVATIDGYKAAPALGSFAFAVFVAAMTGGRWFGPGLIDRFGRVPVLRASALSALVGLMLVVFGHALPIAIFGAALWGLGAALGFPTGMSAAADDPLRAAGRVSVVASIGYLAFLAGPPLIGFLGDRVGVLHALTVTAGLLAVAILVAGACRPLAGFSTVGEAKA